MSVNFFINWSSFSSLEWTHRTYYPSSAIRLEQTLIAGISCWHPNNLKIATMNLVLVHSLLVPVHFILMIKSVLSSPHYGICPLLYIPLSLSTEICIVPVCGEDEENLWALFSAKETDQCVHWFAFILHWLGLENHQQCLCENSMHVQVSAFSRAPLSHWVISLTLYACIHVCMCVYIYMFVFICACRYAYILCFVQYYSAT